MMRLFYFLLMMVLPFVSIAQAVDNTMAYKNIPADGYFRLNYENDYFTARDRYYTQGVVAEVVHPVFSRSFLRYAFPGLKNGNKRVGIAFEHDAYTATKIDRDSILYGDRPFTAVLALRPFAISTDGYKQRLTSALTLGVIGPAAGGNEVQTTIHENTGNIIPKGWRNQIANDIAINYQLGYERNMVMVKNNFAINADAVIRLGTISNKASVGSTFIVGLFSSPFSTTTPERKFNVFVYDRPSVNVIAYDATLQGGMFNKNSMYTIDAANIRRATFENRWGVGLRYKAINLEYFQTYLTKEFDSQMDHRWGGIQIAVAF
jgi:Uncharacterized protein conserved in bacteria